MFYRFLPEIQMAKKLSKPEVVKYARKIYDEIDSGTHKFHLKKLKEDRGYYDCFTQDITLDYRNQIIPTIIHELLHHIHPEWSEPQVLQMESYLINNLTENQIKTIIKKFAENI